MTRSVLFHESGPKMSSIFAWLMLHGREPQKKTPEELARVLRVIVAQPVKVVPRALGYGTAKPMKVWRAVAEVEGRVMAWAILLAAITADAQPS